MCMSSVTSTDPATAAAVATMVKAQDVAKQQGEAAVKLIDASAPSTPPSGQGTLIHTVA